jgi:Ni/Co efflux regulator RcnB
MRSYSVPTLTAMAVGLCLMSGSALADRDRDRDRDRDGRDQATEEDDNNRGERRRERRRPDQQQQQAPQPQTLPQEQERRGWDGNRDDDRRGDWNDGRRDRDARDNRFDNDRRYGDRDRRFDNRDRRRGNWAQFRRSFDAPRRFRVGVYHAPPGYRYHRWSHGQRLPRAYFARSYWLTDFVIYGLFAPPPGLMWVRYGPDALLIDTYTGEIVQVRYNVFYY